MIRKALFVVFILLVNYAEAKTWYHLKFDLQYSALPNQTGAIQFKLVMTGNMGTKQDSFWIQGDHVFERHYVFEDSFRFDWIYYLVLNSNGDTMRYFEPGGGYSKQLCEGYLEEKPFSGQPCADFSEYNLGVVCGTLQFNYVHDNHSDGITFSGGNQEEVLAIYCMPDQQDSAEMLVLSAPCYFQYNNAANDIKWYQSNAGLNNWILVDSGFTFYPNKSLEAGAIFSQKRFYKAVVDKNGVKGIDDYSSNIFGPVLFYSGAVADSLVLRKNTRCYERTRLLFYFDTSYLSPDRGLPKLWLHYQSHDSTREQRFFLGDIQQSPVDIFGAKIYPDTSSSDTSGIVLQQIGTYRLECDFVPWHHKKCVPKYYVLKNEEIDSGFFNAHVSSKKDLRCFGDNNAELKIALESSAADTFVILWNNGVFDTSKVFDQLGAGIQHFKIRRSDGCIMPLNVMIRQPPKFFCSLGIDTTLCNGQTLVLNIQHVLAKKYLCLYGKDTVSGADNFELEKEGKYFISWMDSMGCKARDSVELHRIEKTVRHDFLVPSQAFVNTDVFAVIHSEPFGDMYVWTSPDKCNSFDEDFDTRGFYFKDTGLFPLKLYGKYGDCGFTKEKKIRIFGGTDSAKMDPGMGYLGPLIKDIRISPNPNDGWNYKLIIKLRNEADIALYKIDPVSGEIIDDCVIKSTTVYEENIFADRDADPGVYYLKIIVENEQKLLKVVVSR